jgi:hypothetical protein
MELIIKNIEQRIKNLIVCIDILPIEKGMKMAYDGEIEFLTEVLNALKKTQNENEAV